MLTKQGIDRLEVSAGGIGTLQIKRGVFLFSLTLAEYGAKGEGRIGALKSPMMIVSQDRGIGSRELANSS